MEIGTGFGTDLGALDAASSSLLPGLIPDLPQSGLGGTAMPEAAIEEILARGNAASLETAIADGPTSLLPPIFQLESSRVAGAKGTLILDKDFLVDPLNPQNQVF